MLLWDYEMSDAKGKLDALSGYARAVVGLDTLDATLRILLEMPERRITEDGVSFIERTSDYCRQSLTRPHIDEADLEALFDELYTLKDREYLAGSSLLMALSDCIDGLPNRFDSNTVLRIMSACYESVLASQALGRIITVDMEQANPSCVHAIAMQRQIIDNTLT